MLSPTIYRHHTQETTPKEGGEVIEGFTPGKWEYGKFNNFEHLDIEANGKHICSIYCGLETDQEAEANCRLITSAPALLEENKRLKELAAVRLATIKEANKQIEMLREALKDIKDEHRYMAVNYAGYTNREGAKSHWSKIASIQAANDALQAIS